MLTDILSLIFCCFCAFLLCFFFKIRYLTLFSHHFVVFYNYFIVFTRPKQLQPQKYHQHRKGYGLKTFLILGLIFLGDHYYLKPYDKWIILTNSFKLDIILSSGAVSNHPHNLMTRQLTRLRQVALWCNCVIG